jgi:hypothetical protein
MLVVFAFLERFIHCIAPESLRLVSKPFKGGMGRGEIKIHFIILLKFVCHLKICHKYGNHVIGDQINARADCDPQNAPALHFLSPTSLLFPSSSQVFPL